jgi:hypothetical protein
VTESLVKPLRSLSVLCTSAANGIFSISSLRVTRSLVAALLHSVSEAIYDVEFYAVGEELYAIETLKSRPRPKVIPEAITPRITCLVPE